MTPLARQMDLILQAEEAKDALRLCMHELFSIHLQFGNKQNAIDHSPGLKKGMELLGGDFEEDIKLIKEKMSVCF